MYDVSIIAEITVKNLLGADLRGKNPAIHWLKNLAYFKN